MEFRVLGPLEVLDGGRPLHPTGTKQRALLALLLLNANRTITARALIDALWGERPPEDAQHNLQVHISKLRRSLGGAAARSSVSIDTEPGGYVLRVDPQRIDLNVFEQTVERGRQALASGATEQAARVLGQAMAMWRGPPLADLSHESIPGHYVARLEDLRLGAVEDRLEAELRLGRHAHLVADLQGLVSDHPLRERLRAHLMLALYRSGRQAEALQAYRDAQAILRDELGIDPGPELQRLERAILRQERELEWSGPGRVLEREPSGGPRRRLRRAIILASALILAIVAVAIALTLNTGPGTNPLAADAVRAIDPRANKVGVAIPTDGDAPTALAWNEGDLWVVNTASRTIARIDPKVGQVSHTLSADGVPTDIASGFGSVWILNGFDGEVLRIDPQTNLPVATIRVSAGAGAIAVGEGAVWVTNTLGVSVVKISPDLNEVEALFQIAPDGGEVAPKALAVGEGGVWVANSLEGTVWRLDPADGRVVSRVGLRDIPTSITVGEGAVWVTSGPSDVVFRIDAASGLQSSVAVGDAPGGIAAASGAVWVANQGDGTVTRIDPASMDVVATLDVGGHPEEITVGNGTVWVSIIS